jgi:hypothetical protein
VNSEVPERFDAKMLDPTRLAILAVPDTFAATMVALFNTERVVTIA